METPLSPAPTRTRRVLAAVVAVGLLLTWAATIQARILIDRSIQDRVDFQGALLGASIQGELDAIERDLHTIEGLFLASEEVTDAEFDEFTKHLNVDSAVSGMGLVSIVPAADLPLFETRLASQVPGYRVYELGVDGSWNTVAPRDTYFPVRFCTVCNDDILLAPGFDLGSDLEQLSYIETAVARGVSARLGLEHTTATPLLSLPFTMREGFMVYHHVVDNSGATVGLAFAEVVLGDLVTSRLPEITAETLEWTIHDLTGDPLSANDGQKYVSSTPLSTGGQSWELDTRPTATSPILADQGGTYWVAATGILVTLLVASWGLGRFRKYESSRRMVEMEEILDAKDQFVASVSHELRTPLTSVVGFAEVLRDKYAALSAQDRDEIVNLVADEAAAIAAIVDDLLVVARADHGTLKVSSSPLDLERIAVGIIDTRHTENHIPIVNTCPGVRAFADVDRVRQIVRNLVNNAVSYGGPNMRLNVARIGESAVLAVSDDGPGVPAALADMIFEPYQTAHNDIGNPESVGLGLYVARTLARRMNGDLTYRRASGETVFELSLPVCSEASRRGGPALPDRINEASGSASVAG